MPWSRIWSGWCADRVPSSLGSAPGGSGRVNVLMVAPYALWTPHLETDLEIAETRLEAGDRVAFLVCERELPFCDTNKHHKRALCFECVGRRRDGIARLSRPVDVHRIRDFLGAKDHALLGGLPERFRSQAELRDFEFEGFDLGLATLSSLISVFRDADVELGPDPKRRRVVAGFLRGAAASFLATRRALRATQADRVYLFNGRLAPTRGALRACQQAGVTCFVHERGCDLEHYALYENTLPHDIAYNETRIRAAWQDGRRSRDEKVAIADAWYAARARGVIPNWFSYAGSQEAGALPADWDSERYNVALYVSSEEECAAIGKEWSGPLFGDQADAVRVLCGALAERAPRLQLYIRLHPNQAGLDNRSIRLLRSLASERVSVLAPESRVNSYDLLRASDKVVSFGSTVGVEAAYWGKPSVLLGSCFFRNLGSTYLPPDFAAAVEAIAAELPPKDREGALMYGYDQATFGVRFRHFRPDGVVAGHFKGARLRPPPLYAAASRASASARAVKRAAGGLARSVARRH